MPARPTVSQARRESDRRSGTAPAAAAPAPAPGAGGGREQLVDQAGLAPEEAVGVERVAEAQQLVVEVVPHLVDQRAQERPVADDLAALGRQHPDADQLAAAGRLVEPVQLAAGVRGRAAFTCTRRGRTRRTAHNSSQMTWATRSVRGRSPCASGHSSRNTAARQARRRRGGEWRRWRCCDRSRVVAGASGGDGSWAWDESTCGVRRVSAAVAWRGVRRADAPARAALTRRTPQQLVPWPTRPPSAPGARRSR